MSLFPLGLISQGGGAISYWIGLLTGSGVDYSRSAAVDTSGNLYIVGDSSTVDSARDIYIAKYNNNGSLQWQRLLGDATTEQIGYSIASDTSSNVYLTGTHNSGIITAKYNTSGTIQWQRGLTGTTSFGYGIDVDSSGNAYVTGTRSVSSEAKMYFAKYNTSGAIQWQTTLGYTPAGSGQDNARAIASDSSGNTYFTGWDYLGYWTVGKYNASGTLQWQRRTTNNSNGRGNGIAIDSSGNSYSVGGQEGMSIKAYSSAGSLQWWTRLGTISSWQKASLDTSGNIYVIGTQNNDIQLAKYNSSGTIQWQRTIATSATDTGYGIKIGSDGAMYITGYTNISGNNDVFVAKLPADGSKTGTYTVGGYSFTYAASSLATSSITPTESANTLSTISGSLTDAATTVTEQAGTLTASTTQI